MFVKVPLNWFELNADRKVVDDVTNHVYQVSVGLALLETAFGVIPVCDYSITICPCFDPFHPISGDKEWLRRWVRQNGMNNGKKANSSKQLFTIIVRGFLDLCPGTRCFLSCASALQHKGA